MKSRSIFIIGTFTILSLIGFTLVNTKSISERNLNYLRASGEKENDRSFAGAAEYYNMITADPSTGLINPAYVLAAHKQLDMMSNFRAGIPLSWDFRGPDNVGGRTRVLIIDNKNPSILYVGSVAGGIFKSINGGEHWVSKKYTAEMGALIISCGAQAKNGDLYFGTGEQNFTRLANGDLSSGNMGGGIYKSTDRGETFTRLSSTDPTDPKWQKIQAIAINPQNDNIYAATESGLYESNDQGATWVKYPGTPTVRCIDVKVSPDGNTVFAATWSGMSCKLYRSLNHGSLTLLGGTTFLQYTVRVVIAISPSNPNYVYVSAAASGAGGNYSRNALEGIYKSTDNGDNFTKIVQGGTEAEPFGRPGTYQGDYDHCISVDPYNPNRFFFGGVDFYMYEDGMWYKGASLIQYNSPTDVNEYYIHADKHFITFDTISKPYKMYVTTDGGVALSLNAQSKKYPTYKTMNINYTSAQFYALAASKYDDIIGGTQDNGTFLTENSSITGKNAKEILGGDGFYTEISAYEPNTFITETTDGNIYRSKDRGVNQQKLRLGKLKEGLTSTISFPFNSPFRFYENLVDSTFTDSLQTPPRLVDTTLVISKLFLCGNNKVWLNLDAHDFSKEADKWFLLTPSDFVLYPLCIEYARDGNTIFVGGTTTQGGSTGYLYRISGIKNATYKYDPNLPFEESVPGIKVELIKTWGNRVVTGIGISPGNDNNMVVTLGNYVSTTLDHVFLTKNALATSPTFTAIQGSGSGKLPAMPVYDAAIHSGGNGTDSIIITTEMGVFTTVDGGTNWTEANDGMVRVPTYMIRQIKHVSQWNNYGFMYYIATHGRGIFSAKIGSFFSIPDKTAFMKPDMTVFPNPALSSTNVTFNLTKSSNITIQIFDLTGRTIQTYNFKQAKAGINTFPLNTCTFKPGTYMVRANVEGQNITSKLMISK